MNHSDIPDELFVNRLEGVIKQLSTDAQVEYIKNMTELDVADPFTNLDDDDDNLQKEEDALNDSVAGLQNELDQVKQDTPILERDGRDINDLLVSPLFDDMDNLRPMSSPLSSASLVDESNEWHNTNSIDTPRDTDTIFDQLELEFKELFHDSDPTAAITPVSNTPTDVCESAATDIQVEAASNTTLPTTNRPAARRLDPTILEGDFRNVVDPKQLSEQAITEEYAGLFGLTVEPESVICVRLFECIVRPDIQCRNIMHALYPAFETQGLVIQESQGSHVVLELPANVRAQEWHYVDVQICIHRRLRQRALVCRFLKRLSIMSDSKPQQNMGPQTRIFVEQARHALLSQKLSFSCLYGESKDAIAGLDKQFLTQLEGACRDRMYASFKESISPMEDQARSYEWRCARLMSTLEPIYKEHNVDLPQVAAVADIHEYPLDALSLIQSESSDEVEDESSLEAVAYILHLRDKYWSHVQQRCDAELTARIQRFNARIMDRVRTTQEHQKWLLRKLLEDARANKSALTLGFRRALDGMEAGPGSAVDFLADNELPLYYCYCLVSGVPATFYLTKNFLCFVSKIVAPLIPRWNKLIPVQCIKSVKRHVGGYMSVPNTIDLSVTSAEGNSSYYFTPTPTDAGRVIDVIAEVIALTRDPSTPGLQQANSLRNDRLAAQLSAPGYVSFEPVLLNEDRIPSQGQMTPRHIEI